MLKCLKLAICWWDLTADPSAVFGTFGAVAIAGYALKLDSKRFVNAYGLAGNVASGLIAWVDDPTEHSRSYGIGVAAGICHLIQLMHQPST